jgi:hypothetical protein
MSYPRATIQYFEISIKGQRASESRNNRKDVLWECFFFEDQPS